MARKGAKSRTSITDLRSTGTRTRKPRADLEQQLENYRRELAEAREHLAQALQRQTATSEVLGVISSSPGELEPVFQTMLANATRICEATFGVLYLYEGDAFRAVALHGAAPPSFVENRRRNPVFRPSPGTGLARVATTRQTVQILDAQAEPAYQDSSPTQAAGIETGGIRTILCVPLLKQGELIGTFNLLRQEVRPFTDKQIELVTSFANQAVIAIENVRLFDDVQARTRELSESLEQQTATSEVLQVISSSPGELQPVFEAMLESATRICGAKFGNLFLRAGAGFRAAAVHGPATSYVDWYRREPVLDSSELLNTPLARVASSKESLHILDLREERAYREQNSRIVALVESAGARTILGVPLLRQTGWLHVADGENICLSSESGQPVGARPTLAGG